MLLCRWQILLASKRIADSYSEVCAHAGRTRTWGHPAIAEQPHVLFIDILSSTAYLTMSMLLDRQPNGVFSL